MATKPDSGWNPIGGNPHHDVPSCVDRLPFIGRHVRPPGSRVERQGHNTNARIYVGAERETGKCAVMGLGYDRDGFCLTIVFFILWVFSQIQCFNMAVEISELKQRVLYLEQSLDRIIKQEHNDIHEADWWKNDVED